MKIQKMGYKTKNILFNVIILFLIIVFNLIFFFKFNLNFIDFILILIVTKIIINYNLLKIILFFIDRKGLLFLIEKKERFESNTENLNLLFLIDFLLKIVIFIILVFYLFNDKFQTLFFISSYLFFIFSQFVSFFFNLKITLIQVFSCYCYEKINLSSYGLYKIKEYEKLLLFNKSKYIFLDSLTPENSDLDSIFIQIDLNTDIKNK